MTYKHLTKLIKENTDKSTFDLTFLNVKSKVIFAVGNGAGNVSAMLSSIMSTCEISNSRYINIEHFELQDRFVRQGQVISIDELCVSASKIRRKSKNLIFGSDLILSLSLNLLDGEYIIIEIDEEYYKSMINRINFSPFAVLLCSLDDDKNNELIKITPSKTHICTLSQKENYDYIRKADENGRKTVFASKNKYLLKTANLLGADFYHFSYLYHIPCIDLNNILLATLAIESATTLLGTPRPYMYKGISNAELPLDLKLHSVSPTILLKIGDGNFNLHRNLNFEKITDVIPSSKPTSNTVFYGSAEYIHKVKKAMQ